MPLCKLYLAIFLWMACIHTYHVDIRRIGYSTKRYDVRYPLETFNMRNGEAVFIHCCQQLPLEPDYIIAQWIN